MHRAPLLQLVESYEIKYLAETETVSKYKDFVIANENCFERSLLEGHITCGAWILDGSGTKTLLTHHRKLNRWLQLGGHADGDHDVLRLEVAVTLVVVAVEVLEDGDSLRDLAFHVVLVQTVRLIVQQFLEAAPRRMLQVQHEAGLEGALAGDIVPIGEGGGERRQDAERQPDPALRAGPAY